MLAYLREYEGETILVVANLSRFAQAVQLPLSAHAGEIPIELFGQAPFPTIGDAPYPLTLSPHGFYWFNLVKDLPGSEGEVFSSQLAEQAEAPARTLPTLQLAGGLETVLVDTLIQGNAREGLERALPDFLKGQRWFGGGGRAMRSVKLVDAVRVQAKPLPVYISLLRVTFEDGSVERYFLPLAAARGEAAERVMETRPRAALAWLGGEGGGALLHDATANPEVWSALYRAVQRGWKGRSLQGLYSAEALPGAELPDTDEVTVLSVEQSNSSAIFGKTAFAKLYRKLEDGPNPEVELLDYLTKAGFPFVPRVKGRLDFRRGRLAAQSGRVSGSLGERGRRLELRARRDAALLGPRRQHHAAPRRAAEEPQRHPARLVGGLRG